MKLPQSRSKDGNDDYPLIPRDPMWLPKHKTTYTAPAPYVNKMFYLA